MSKQQGDVAAASHFEMLSAARNQAIIDDSRMEEAGVAQGHQGHT